MEPNEHAGAEAHPATDPDAEPIVDLTHAAPADEPSDSAEPVASGGSEVPGASEVPDATTAPEAPVVAEATADSDEPVLDDAPVDASAEAAVADELTVLAGIEDDFAAVEAAMEGLDRIDAREVGGAAAAAQVEAIVGSGRFDVAG